MRGGLYQCRPASLSPVMPKFSNHCQSSLGNIPVELHTQHGHGPTAPQILWVFPTLSQCVISPFQTPRAQSLLAKLWAEWLREHRTAWMPGAMTTTHGCFGDRGMGAMQCGRGVCTSDCTKVPLGAVSAVWLSGVIAAHANISELAWVPAVQGSK